MAHVLNKCARNIFTLEYMTHRPAHSHIGIYDSSVNRVTWIYDSSVKLIWLVCQIDMTHLSNWYDSSVEQIWLICQQSHIWIYYSSVKLIWLICQTDMTHLSNRYDSSVNRVTFEYITHLSNWYDSSVKLIWLSCQSCQTDQTHLSTKSHRKIWLIAQTDVQPIADRVAQNLEIISKNFRFSTRRTKILMGLIIYYLILIVNPMGRILVLEKV